MICLARGSGNGGIRWHHDGRAAKVGNRIADMVACAEYMIEQGYTSPGRLATYGLSAGGLANGGAAIARPDLFGATWLRVPRIDLLRAHLEPNGQANSDDYGNINDPAQFNVMRAVDPIVNIRAGQRYPAMIVRAGFNDRRVKASGPAKLVAHAQAATKDGRSALLFMSDAGHNAVESSLGDVFAFLLWQLTASDSSR